jgi:hypothetical protein
MLPRFVNEVLMDGKTLNLRARARFYDITFEIYAFRELTQDEVHHIVAAYIMGNRGGVVKGATYKIVSNVGNDD